MTILLSQFGGWPAASLALSSAKLQAQSAQNGPVLAVLGKAGLTYHAALWQADSLLLLCLYMTSISWH